MPLVSVLSDELAKLVRPWETRALRIMPSQLGYFGGVLGAAALAFERMRDSQLNHPRVPDSNFSSISSAPVRPVASHVSDDLNV